MKESWSNLLTPCSRGCSIEVQRTGRGGPREPPARSHPSSTGDRLKPTPCDEKWTTANTRRQTMPGVRCVILEVARTDAPKPATGGNERHDRGAKEGTNGEMGTRPPRTRDHGATGLDPRELRECDGQRRAGQCARPLSAGSIPALPPLRQGLVRWERTSEEATGARNSAEAESRCPAVARSDEVALPPGSSPEPIGPGAHRRALAVGLIGTRPRSPPRAGSIPAEPRPEHHGPGLSGAQGGVASVLKGV